MELCISNLYDKILGGLLQADTSIHRVVFESHGMDVQPHGFEWMAEMMRIGFKDPDWETDGCDFFSEEEYQSILELLPKEGECE